MLSTGFTCTKTVTLLGANIAPRKDDCEDDPFPNAAYVRSLKDTKLNPSGLESDA